ncbi:hypothetical protein LOTGIDRAFT_122098 [Lottia gigantea]|uniref:Protein N-terminal glutamine amidohydrolase n=1 Tax=Lottia gigantea TaxID=225164 RepID=V4ADZ0_LOTGI|nr:hypothetical protein LOTGIDRAFT_122098 [Lottia gigantea]ESO91546.1 hypothetical protein LOTGIDRAFT_122098 [Lottia gigantea]
MNLTEEKLGRLVEKPDCVYTTCYCEENIWKLCDKTRQMHPGILPKCYCVFISNLKRMIPLWCQKSSKRSDKRVIWDYHVIFIYKGDPEPVIYDLDTTLPFPCSISEYIDSAITNEDRFNNDFKRLFRVIKAREYLETFASDRSHMIDEETGDYQSPPPKYPCIQTSECSNNIQEFINMEKGNGVGVVMTLPEFCDRFSKS